MTQSCRKHPHETGADLCGRCGESWCGTCLVYAFGAKKPPFCMSCAMVAGGVRTDGALPALSRRDLRTRRKAQRTAERLARDVDAMPDPEADAADASDGTDWTAPWWEDRQPTLAD